MGFFFVLLVFVSVGSSLFYSFFFVSLLSLGGVLFWSLAFVLAFGSGQETSGDREGGEHLVDARFREEHRLVQEWRVHGEHYGFQAIHVEG